MAIITVIGLRHGKAAQPKPTGLTAAEIQDADISRPLDEIGRRQASERANKLEGVKFDKIFCSPAERALETAEIVTDQGREDFTILNELFTPTGEDGEIIDQMFKVLGYKPASAYIEHELNTERRVRYNDSPVERMSTNAGGAIARQLAENEYFQVIDQTILVAGHAVYTPLAVKGLVDILVGANEKVCAFLNDLNMGEAGAFRVTFNTHVLTQTTFDAFE
jgi:phosphohistidine phosphatase SixA